MGRAEDRRARQQSATQQALDPKEITRAAIEQRKKKPVRSTSTRRSLRQVFEDRAKSAQAGAKEQAKEQADRQKLDLLIQQAIRKFARQPHKTDILTVRKGWLRTGKMAGWLIDTSEEYYLLYEDTDGVRHTHESTTDTYLLADGQFGTLSSSQSTGRFGPTAKISRIATTYAMPPGLSVSKAIDLLNRKLG